MSAQPAATAVGAEPRDLQETMADLGDRAREAAAELALADAKVKAQALQAAAAAIRDQTPVIQEANALDMAAGREKGLTAALLDRLELTPERIEAMAKGLEDIAAFPDPVGKVLAEWERPNGLKIARVSVPLGVIGIIYESRPNVTADAGALCLKSGNAAILRGGSESFRSSGAILDCLQAGLKAVPGRHPAHSHHRPGGGRDPAHHERLRRRHRAPGRSWPDRAGARGKPDPGVLSSRRHGSYLYPRGRQSGHGAYPGGEREDAPTRHLRGD